MGSEDRIESENVALRQEAAAETGQLEESKGWIRTSFLWKGAERQMLLQNITGTPQDNDGS